MITSLMRHQHASGCWHMAPSAAATGTMRQLAGPAHAWTLKHTRSGAGSSAVTTHSHTTRGGHNATH